MRMRARSTLRLSSTALAERRWRTSRCLMFISRLAAEAPLKTQRGVSLPEFAGEYFMLGPIPAYGLYARGVRGLTLQNIRLADCDIRSASRRHLRSCHRCRGLRAQRHGRCSGGVGASLHVEQAGPDHCAASARLHKGLSFARRFRQRAHRHRWRGYFLRRATACPQGRRQQGFCEVSRLTSCTTAISGA